MSVQAHVTGIQHIGIPTNDIEQTIRFYQSLGFETRFRTVNGQEQVAFLTLKNLTVETYQTGRAAGIPGAIDHVALDVDDIEATYAAVTALGYKALDGQGIHFLPFWEKGVRFFTIAGPNGEKVEFSQML